MNLSRTVSEINGDFNHPVYFALPLKGFPWNWLPALGVQKLE